MADHPHDLGQRAVACASASSGWARSADGSPRGSRIGGEQVSVLARGETLQLVRAEGVRLDEQGEEFVAKVDAADDCDAIGEQDVVVIAVKAPALPALASELTPLIGPDTMIVPMLNGVPWWFLEGERAAIPSIQMEASPPHCRRNRSSAASSMRRAAARRPIASTVKHADKLIIGEPGGATSARVSSPVRLAGRRRPEARPDGQYPPGDLVQAVGQCDDQSAVGADPSDRRQDFGRH